MSNESSAKKLFNASLALYVLGTVTFVPAIVSVILSLVSASKGHFTKRRFEVTVLAVSELIAWIIAASLCWIYSCSYYSSYYYYYSYYYGSYYGYKCTLTWQSWIGWMPLTLWLLLNLALGVPRMVFQSTPDGAVELDAAATTGSSDGIFAATAKAVKKVGPYEQKARNLYVAAFLCQIVGIFTILPAIGSISITFHMLRVGYIRRRFALVLSLAIMEFLTVLSLWIPTLLYGTLYYLGIFSGDLGQEQVVFLHAPVASIFLGITRVLLAGQYDGAINRDQGIQPGGLAAMLDMSPESLRKRTRRSFNLAAVMLFIFGLVFYVTTPISILMSLLSAKGNHLRRPSLVVALSILELIAVAVNYYFTVAFLMRGYYAHVQVGLFVMRVICLALAMPRLILTGDFAEDPASKVEGIRFDTIAPSQQRRLSIEGLAVELNQPNLIKLSGKISAQQLKAMKYADVNKLCPMTPEDFIKLKQAIQ